MKRHIAGPRQSGATTHLAGVLVLLLTPLVLHAVPLINEVMTANISSIQDDFERDMASCPVENSEAWFTAMGTSTNDGDNPDWVEIVNPDTVALNLAGYTLSDDSLQPRRWIFPSIILPPGGRTVVFATGKNRAATPYWHTNFGLSEGEPVVLTSPSGARCDIMSTAGLPGDMSRGRLPDMSGPWVIFTTATPGQPNAGTPFAGYRDSIIMSPAPGLHTVPLSVTLSTLAPTVQIRFTLDGSDPLASSPVYTSPLKVDTVCVIKARCYEGGAFTSLIATGTYWAGAVHTMPVVSITTTPANLWDPYTGIYVPGANADEPNRVANYWQDWERPAHVEFYEKSGLTFSRDCGIKVDGWGSQGRPRKSLQVFTTDKYGASWFRYPVFPHEPYDKYQCLVLRAGSDWDGAMIRDPAVSVIARGLGLDYQAFRPVVVYLNGVYWGVHDLRENMNRSYFDAHHNTDRDSIDVIKNYWRRTNPDVVHGDSVEYTELVNYLTTHNLTNQTDYDWVASRVDEGNFATYNAIETYTSNYDWPGNNNKCWRPETPGAKWKWALYDLDYAFNLWASADTSYNMLNHATATTTTWPNPVHTTLLQRSLLTNRSFIEMFVNRYCDLMNTRLLPDTMLRIIDSITTLYTPEMTRHIARWASQSTNVRTTTDWNKCVEVIRRFLRSRQPYAKEHIRSKFSLTAHRKLSLRIVPAGAGALRLNSITISDTSWSGDYFPGIPVRLSVIPMPGYRFVAWSGATLADPSQASITVDPLAVTSLTATFAVNSGALNAIVLNEINYNSSATFTAGDWIELYNGYAVAVDISGWVLRDSDPSHGFTFPSGTSIPAGGYLVIAENPTAFTAAFPAIRTLGPSGFGLDGGGEPVRLSDATGRIVDSLTYDDALPWPVEADGTGPSLALIDPACDNSLGTNWTASAGNGTPGRANLCTAALSVRPTKPPRALDLHMAGNARGSTVRLNVAVPGDGHVSLRVYALDGSLVASLLNRSLYAGMHTMVWTHPPASGVFIYSLCQGSSNKSATIRLW